MKLKYEFCRDFFSEKLYFAEDEDNLYEEIDEWCKGYLSTNHLSDDTYEYIKNAYLGMLKQREFDTVSVYISRGGSHQQESNSASFTVAPRSNTSFIFSTPAPTTQVLSRWPRSNPPITFSTPAPPTPLNYINNRVKNKSKNHSSIKTTRLNFSRVIKFIPSHNDTKGWENFISDLDKMGTKMWDSIENKIKEGRNNSSDVEKAKNLKGAGKIILDLARNNTATNPGGGKKKSLKYCLAYYNLLVREGVPFQERLTETKYENCAKGNFTQISCPQLLQTSHLNQRYFPPPKSIDSQFIGGALVGAIVGAFFVWLFFILLSAKRAGNEKNKPLANISRLEAQVNSKKSVRFASNI